MEKQKDKVLDKGSTSVKSAISTLTSSGTVKTSDSIFRIVINTLRTTYSKLIEDKSLTVDFGNCQITLN